MIDRAARPSFNPLPSHFGKSVYVCEGFVCVSVMKDVYEISLWGSLSSSIYSDTYYCDEKKNSKIGFEIRVDCESCIKTSVEEREERIHISAHVAFVFRLCFTYLSKQKSHLFHARNARRTLENASNAHGGFYLILNYLV